MNYWTQCSVEYANSRAYLDDLFCVYPMLNNLPRQIDENVWQNIEKAFGERNDIELLEAALQLELLPLKDSYLSYLRRDKSALRRNPKTVARLATCLYEIGLNEIYKRIAQPKETNRQVGSLFNNWLKKRLLGAPLLNPEEFASTTDNAVLMDTEAERTSFAREFLNYRRDKGLDFVARYNERFVIGEAKFLTDFGGHQNAQLNDAIDTLNSDCEAVVVAILDGVVYIPNSGKMNRVLNEERDPDHVILSALLLRDFLNQI